MKSKEILRQKSVPLIQSFHREAYSGSVFPNSTVDVCYVFEIHFKGSIFTIKCLDRSVANKYFLNNPKSPIILDQRILPACEQYLREIEPENIIELNLFCISTSYEGNIFEKNF